MVFYFSNIFPGDFKKAARKVGGEGPYYRFEEENSRN